MVSLEKFNQQHHRYIYSIRWCNGINCGYSVYGCIGRLFYIGYTLAEVVKRYNKGAKSAKY